MKIGRLVRVIPLLLITLAGSACEDETAPLEDHHPFSARLFIGGAQASPNVVLLANGPVQIETRFYDEDGDQITLIDLDHYTRLTFNPGSIGTVSDDPNHNFRKNVAVGAPATGTVTVGYGHDSAADEESFGPFNVTVQ